MRGATRCAQRLKAVFNSLRSKLGKLSLPAAADPVTQCILGILSRDMPESKAREALDRIRNLVVDFNELRVVPPIELAEMVGDYPDARLKCEDISRALNKIFALHHNITLEHLLQQPKKEVIAYLERIDGLEDYTRARIRLLGLQQHAVPLDEAMWAYARQQGIVDARCPLGEAQAFLERQIADGDALEFFVLLNRQAWAEMGTAVRRREVARILSVPPDRTTRNMLQTIGSLSEPEAPVLLEDELEHEHEFEPAVGDDHSQGDAEAERSKPRHKIKRSAPAAKPAKATAVKPRRTATARGKTSGKKPAAKPRPAKAKR